MTRRAWVAPFMLLSCAAPASGQIQYEGIPVPPYEFYEALLAYADQKDYDAFPRALKFTLPLLKYLDRTYGEQLEERLNAAVREHDPARLMDGLRRVLYLDMVSHLQAVVAGPEPSRQDRAQMAFINYTFLSPEVRRHSRARDRLIRTLFRDLVVSRSGGNVAMETARLQQVIADGLGWIVK